MSGTDEQRAILASEFVWFGGQVGSPKVFDAGTHYSASPSVRGLRDQAEALFPEGPAQDPVGASRRYACFVVEDGRWSMTIEDA